MSDAFSRIGVDGGQENKGGSPGVVWKKDKHSEMSKSAENAGRCPLCGRPLGRFKASHHLIPRLVGGKETVTSHPICHVKIHSVFSSRQLAREYSTIESLRKHPEIIKFVGWVSKKPPDFHDSSRQTRKRRFGQKA